MTISLPTEDRSFLSKTELTERIAVCLGGRVAEQLVLGDISTGASNDLQRASSTARAMVMKYGMSEKLGAITFDNEGDEVFIGRTMAQSRTYSEEVAGLIDEEVHKIVDGQYERCVQILTEQRDALEVTAQFLMKYETMSAREFEQVFTDPEGLMTRKEAEEAAREEAEKQSAAEVQAPEEPEEEEAAPTLAQMLEEQLNTLPLMDSEDDDSEDSDEDDE